jgi:hypothetical protein
MRAATAPSGYDDQHGEGRRADTDRVDPAQPHVMRAPRHAADGERRRGVPDVEDGDVLLGGDGP